MLGSLALSPFTKNDAEGVRGSLEPLGARTGRIRLLERRDELLLVCAGQPAPRTRLTCRCRARRRSCAESAALRHDDRVRATSLPGRRNADSRQGDLPRVLAVVDDATGSVGVGREGGRDSQSEGEPHVARSDRSAATRAKDNGHRQQTADAVKEGQQRLGSRGMGPQAGARLRLILTSAVRRTWRSALQGDDADA